MIGERRLTLLWGFVLIVAGGLFLAGNLGLIPALAPLLWALLFAGASLFFFISYFSSGRDEWGWLFPAAITGGIAGTILLTEAGAPGPAAGALFLASVSLPFWVIFGLDRKANWWALIPGWATAVLALVSLLAESAPGEALGALVMFGIALPFFTVYLSNREHWWALIPAGVLSAVGFVVLLSATVRGELIGGFFMAALALPFLFVALRFKEHWWAMIPTGVFATVGLTAMLSALDLPEAVAVRLLGGVFFLGLATTFTVLWMQRYRYPTEWARYPAAVLFAAAVLVVLFALQTEILWAVVLIGAGLWLLYENMRSPKLRE